MITGFNPRKNYFGVPLSGQSVGYVVDTDPAMAPYLDKVAMVTNLVNAAPENDDVTFSLVQAVKLSRGPHLSEMFAQGNGPSDSEEVLQPRLTNGATDLARAMQLAEGWYADELFVVLAKPLSEAEVSSLTQIASQSGAITHVIAFGAAAAQPELSRIADATTGRFVPVSDAKLNEWVAQYDAPRESPK